MLGWHHQLNGHESEQTPGAGDGQGNLAYCSPLGRKESDTIEQLNWTENPVCWVFALYLICLFIYLNYSWAEVLPARSVFHLFRWVPLLLQACIPLLTFRPHPNLQKQKLRGCGPTSPQGDSVSHSSLDTTALWPTVCILNLPTYI